MICRPFLHRVETRSYKYYAPLELQILRSFGAIIYDKMRLYYNRITTVLPPYYHRITIVLQLEAFLSFNPIPDKQVRRAGAAIIAVGRKDQFFTIEGKHRESIENTIISDLLEAGAIEIDHE